MKLRVKVRKEVENMLKRQIAKADKMSKLLINRNNL